MDPNNLLWARDESTFGARMLGKMGWKRGDGLGKNKDGAAISAACMQVKLDTAGIGASAGANKEELWGLRAVSEYENRLKDLKIVVGKDKKAKTKTGKKSKKDRKDKKKDKKNIKDKEKDKKDAKEEKDRKNSKSKVKEEEAKVRKPRLSHRSKFVKSKSVEQYGEDALREILGK